MKQFAFTFIILLYLASPFRAQEKQFYQPDTAKIYFDLTEHPYWHYGEVYTFSCTYDSDGLLSQLKTEWAESGMWYYRKHQYEYDAFHNMTHDRFNGASWEYPPGSQALKVYTYQGNLLSSYANYDYDFHSGPDFWYCVDSSVYDYDKLGRLIETNSYNRNMQHTTTIHYDYPEQHQTVLTTEKLIDGAWNTVSRTTKDFSEEDLLLNSLTETCNGGVYSNSTLVTYTYSTSGKIMEELTQDWTDGAWTNVKLQAYSYNENGYLVSLEIKEWQNGGFENKNRAVYEPNEDGYPVVVTFEKWNGEKWVDGIWKPDLFVYNESYFNRQNKELCGEDVKRIEIHYTNTPMPSYIVQEQGAAQEFCKVFPNPTTGRVTILGQELKQAEVINTLGQCVATATGKGEMLQINIANLPAGVYFVRVKDKEGRKCVRKIVKE